MNKIALLNPYPFVCEYHEGDPRVVFIHRNHITHFCDSGSSTIEKIPFPAVSDVAINHQELRHEILSWEPVFNRWLSNAGDYVLIRSSWVLHALSLIEHLKKKKITHVVFFTASSHHVYTAMVEVACKMAGVRQVFLYPLPLGPKPRLLPMIQLHGVTDREPLGVDVSVENTELYVHEYGARALEKQPPKFNEVTTQMNRRISKACLSLLFIYSKRALSVILNFRSAKPLSKEYNYSFLSTLKMLLRQKRSLGYYSQNTSKNKTIDKLLSTGQTKIMFYAHLQPEASSFPEGGALSEHIDIILRIRQLGYKGPIVYKEHPASYRYYSPVIGASRVGLYRSVDYYKTLQALGCVFASVDYVVPTKFEERCWALSMTGSICLERALRGLPSAYTGEPWYKGCPGTYQISEIFCEGGRLIDPSECKIHSKTPFNWLVELTKNKVLPNPGGVGTGSPIINCDSTSKFNFGLRAIVDSITDDKPPKSNGGNKGN